MSSAKISLLFGNDGEICHRQIVNPFHNPADLPVELVELVPQLDRLGVRELLFDLDAKPGSHTVEIDDEGVRVLPKPDGSQGEPLPLRQLALEAHRTRNRSGRQAIRGMLTLPEVAEEMRTATSWRILRRGADDKRSPEQIVRDDFGLYRASCPAPVVSVVIAVWNMERHLQRTVESVLAQEVDGGLELLLVDNGSVDASRDIMARIAMEDNRVSIIRLEHNLGQAVARNIGILAARGSFLSPFDADDIMLPRVLDKMLSLFSSSSPDTPNSELRTPNSIDAVLCHLDRYSSDLHIPLGRAPWLERDIDGQIIHHRCACLPSQLLIRRTAFTEKGAWYSEWCRWCEDVEWLLHAYFRCRMRFQRLPEVLMRRRTHSGEDSYGRKVSHHHAAWQTGLRVAYGGGRQ